MKNKSIIILSAVFLVLVLLVLLQTFLPKLFKPKSLYEERFKSIKLDAFTKLEISQKEKAIKLTKEGDTWKLNTKKADKEKVEQAINGFLDFSKIELVAETNQRHKELELTDDLAKRISLGDILVLTGKSEGAGTYLRFEKTDPVFVVKSLSSQNLSLDPQDWYDKTIVKIESKSVKMLGFEKPGEKFALILQEDKWKTEDTKQEVDLEKVNPILTILSSFQALSLPEKEEIVKYPTWPTLSLSLEYDSGKEKLEFYKGQSDYLVKRGTDGEYFTTSEYQAKDFLTSKQELIKK